MSMVEIEMEGDHTSSHRGWVMCGGGWQRRHEAQSSSKKIVILSFALCDHHKRGLEASFVKLTKNLHVEGTKSQNLWFCDVILCAKFNFGILQYHYVHTPSVPKKIVQSTGQTVHQKIVNLKCIHSYSRKWLNRESGKMIEKEESMR